MALQKSIDTTSGLTLESAYIKIETTSGNAEMQNLNVCIYADHSARTDGKDPVEQRYYTFPCSVADDSPNFIKQGYEWLKSQEFADATDV